MSKIAGLILLILGGFFVYLGVGQILHLESLTLKAACATAALGGILVIAGLMHFKAPHKAFLVSIPFLLLVQLAVFLIGHYYYNDKRWLYYQCAVALVSILTLWISHRGYKEQQKATP